MSGGVDSAVAAARLVDQGVVGVELRGALGHAGQHGPMTGDGLPVTPGRRSGQRSCGSESHGVFHRGLDQAGKDAQRKPGLRLHMPDRHVAARESTYRISSDKDLFDGARISDIGKRVLPENHEIGPFPRLERSQVLGCAQKLRRAAGCGVAAPLGWHGADGAVLS